MLIKWRVNKEIGNKISKEIYHDLNNFPNLCADNNPYMLDMGGGTGFYPGNSFKTDKNKILFFELSLLLEIIQNLEYFYLILKYSQ